MTESASDMIHILIVIPNRRSLSDLAAALEERGKIRISWAESGSGALDKISAETFDLVVTDEKLDDMTGLEFAGKLVTVNPMINCIAVSSLSPKEFHEASEGLGLLMQLPLNPGQAEADELLQCLNNILTLTRGMKGD